MSKIREALDSLEAKRRKSRSAEPGGRIRESEASTTETADPDQQYTLGARGRIGAVSGIEEERFDPPGASREPKPKTVVQIPRDLLVEERLTPNEEDREIIAQQFRRIKRPIIQTAFEKALPVGKNANVVMLASAMPGAGKTFCAFNLAQSIALERDVGVLLVDADVLKPGMSASLGLENREGLIDYLADPGILLEDILVGTNVDDILVIPSGRKHEQATELLASRRMKTLIDLLSDTYEDRVVIFDTPPLLLTSEAQVLARIVGQVVVVIEARVSSQESLIRALDLLDRDKPINAILNKSRNAVGPDYGQVSYGYYPYSYGGYGGDFDT